MFIIIILVGKAIILRFVFVIKLIELVISLIISSGDGPSPPRDPRGGTIPTEGPKDQRFAKSIKNHTRSTPENTRTHPASPWMPN